MSFTVVIPARYASQRLPGKPLVDIGGKPMIEHVVQRAKQSHANRIIVATDDSRVADVVRGFGGDVCMTSPTHPSGTDRLQEVVSQCALGDDEIVVNVQGDEPMIPAEVINQVADNLRQNKQADAATLCEKITAYSTVFDVNAVKVVTDCEGYALYFSRAAIPWDRDAYRYDKETVVTALARRHIGIYSYRVNLLHQFVQWPVAGLEQVEKLEQLRILANGRKIHVADACVNVPGGIDTQADLDRVRALLV